MHRFPRHPFAAALMAGAALTFAGCGGDDGQNYGADVGEVDDEHVHAEADHGPGPHDGTVVELTTDHSLHGELVIDSDDPARGRFYVLAGDMKTPVEAKSVAIFFDDPESGEETNLDLVPAVGGNEEAAEWLFERDRLPNGGEGDLVGRVVVDIDGEEYEAPFDTGHDAHAGHDHDHDHGDHDHGDEHDHE